MTLAAAFAGLLVLAAPQAPAERIAAIRVHGNHTTPDADILQLAAADVGQPLPPGAIDAIRTRLDRSGRFRSVDVRKRYTSLSDLSAVLVVIVVEEKAGISVDVPDPGPLRTLRSHTMWLPVLRSDDGYGFTYGARVSVVDLLGPGTRVSAPLTWGGERRAAVEVERRFERGPLTRLLAAGGITRREHPAIEVSDRRTGASLRAERAVGSWLRAAATAASWNVRFGEQTDRLTTLGGELVFDTRRDPAFPRNAVFASLGLERLGFDRAADTTRLTADARGYVGVLGQAVVAVRAFHVRAAGSLPVYEQAMLGGDATLRGFELGYRLGDRLLAGSAELRLPLSAPRRITRMGVAVFADAGTVYGAGDRLDAAAWDRGVGAGVFVQAPLFGVRLDVARGIGGGTRVHFNLGTAF